MDIYWIADKKKCGPVTVPDILSRVQMGELTPDTKGWHVGCEQWMPLRELPALADFLQEKQEKKDETSAEPDVSQNASGVSDEVHPADLPVSAVRVYLPSPTVRLLARGVDMSLYVALVFAVVYVRQIEFLPSLLPSGPLVWMGYILIESFLLSSLGTTPGKALFGIHVRCVNGGNMTIGRALSRACLVFVGGMGMMISLLPVFMLGYSWWSLRVRGITMWDIRCGTLPLMQKPANFLRIFMATVVMYACFHVTTACMQPWIPDMVSAIEQQSPEAGQLLRSMMPQEAAPTEK